MFDKIKFSVTSEKEKDNVGRFIISPLPAGFGNTVGLSLRRTLLGALGGAAVTQIKIKGANHIFTTLKGLKEDLVDVALNIKQIRFIYEGDEPITLKLEKKGKGVVKAKDVKLQPGIKIANPNLELANLTDSKASLQISLTIACGFGYEIASEHKSNKLGVVGIDSTFSPIKSVAYWVKQVRKGKRSNLDKLIIEIATDGTIKPKDALIESAKILDEIYRQTIKPKKKAEVEEKEVEPENHNLGLLIEEVDEIPLRLTNALKKAGYKRLEDLVEAGSEKVIKAKNVGENSVKLLKKVLKKRDLEFK